MEMTRFELSLKSKDHQGLEVALSDLEQWLQDRGIRFEWVPEPTAEGELGIDRKTVRLIIFLTAGSIVNESLMAYLHQEHPMLQVHIELREPEQKVQDRKPVAIQPPLEPPPKDHR